MAARAVREVESNAFMVRFLRALLMGAGHLAARPAA
jgi:hypothetical protein